MSEDAQGSLDIDQPEVADIDWVPAGDLAVDFIHHRDHKFKKKKPHEDGRKRLGCEVCGKAKAHMDHVGAPQSLNANSAAANTFGYQSMKKAWEARLIELLTASGLPKGLDHVMVEAQVCFDSRRERDQGNFRFLIEKAMGDALQSGGWLVKDDWDHYEFGRLRQAYEKGKSWTAFTIFPTAGLRAGDSDAIVASVPDPTPEDR